MPDQYTHEVSILLTCNHINIEPIEAAIFTPSIGEVRICNVCRREVRIAKVSPPAWITTEYKPLKKRQE